MDPPWPPFSTFEETARPTSPQLPNWIQAQESPWGERETGWSSNFSLVLLMCRQHHSLIHNTTLLLSKPDGLFRPWHRWLLHADCTKTKVYIKPSLGGHRGCFDACYMSHISFLTKETIPTTFHYYHDDNYYDDGYEMYIEPLKKEIPTVKHLF